VCTKPRRILQHPQRQVQDHRASAKLQASRNRSNSEGTPAAASPFPEDRHGAQRAARRWAGSSGTAQRHQSGHVRGGACERTPHHAQRRERCMCAAPATIGAARSGTGAGRDGAEREASGGGARGQESRAKHTGQSCQISAASKLRVFSWVQARPPLVPRFGTSPQFDQFDDFNGQKLKMAQTRSRSSANAKTR